jgi:CcmD family protein
VTELDKNLSYLFAAYTIIWFAIFIYVYALARKQKDLQREIQVLKESLKSKPKKAAKG